MRATTGTPTASSTAADPSPPRRMIVTATTDAQASRARAATFREAPTEARSSPMTTTVSVEPAMTDRDHPSESTDRGASATTRSKARLAADQTVPAACGISASMAEAGHDTVARPSWRGSASASDSPDTRPSTAARSGHRNPSACSLPRTSSTPAPAGSASSSTAARPRRAPVRPSAAAKVLAPTPPDPPTTDTVQPSTRPSRAAPTAARAAVSSSGSTTALAPRAIAGRHTASGSRARTTT